MRVVCIANQKGGCGKSTVSVNLASALANTGSRILLIDNDPQGHSSLALGLGPDDFSLSTRDLYMSSDIQVEDASIKIKERLDLIPSDIDLVTIEQNLSDISIRLRKLVGCLTHSEIPYDIVLIDCPPNIGLLTFNALLASSEVIVPVDASRFTLEAVERFRETLELLELERGHSLKMHLVLNSFDIRTNHARAVLEELDQEYPGARLETFIHHTVRLREAADHGKPVDEFDRHSRAAHDFEDLAEEIASYPVELAMADIMLWDQALHGPAQGEEGVLFEVRFVDAARVAVTGDFNDWSVDGIPMEQENGGIWRVRLPMERGSYEYKFIVDGVWKVDPENPERIRNNYGQLNSVLVIP